MTILFLIITFWTVQVCWFHPLNHNVGSPSEVKKAEEGDYPSVAYVALNYHEKLPLCNAVITEKEHVVTTAKCVAKYAKSDLIVIGGSKSIAFDPATNKDVQQREVSAVSIPEEWSNSNGKKGNIAVLKLQTSYEKTKFVDFSPLGHQVFDDKVYKLVGYGNDDEKISMDLKSYKKDTCTKLYNKTLPEEQFCAGDIEKEKIITDDDLEGSPLLNSNKIYAIATEKDGVFTKIADYRSWITDIVRRSQYQTTPKKADDDSSDNSDDSSNDSEDSSDDSEDDKNISTSSPTSSTNTSSTGTSATTNPTTANSENTTYKTTTNGTTTTPTTTADSDKTTSRPHTTSANTTVSSTESYTTVAPTTTSSDKTTSNSTNTSTTITSTPTTTSSEKSTTTVTTTTNEMDETSFEPEETTPISTTTELNDEETNKSFEQEETTTSVPRTTDSDDTTECDETEGTTASISTTTNSNDGTTEESCESEEATTSTSSTTTEDDATEESEETTALTPTTTSDSSEEISTTDDNDETSGETTSNPQTKTSEGGISDNNASIHESIEENIDPELALAFDSGTRNEFTNHQKVPKNSSPSRSSLSLLPSIFSKVGIFLNALKNVKKFVIA